ncbi:MAG: ParB/RepB/Spo0J family partition protein [Bacteroidia bacterium]|nr:ParB/RepB/Spo0J family partition protein [Bacteroidia bacterium]
MVTKKSVLGRGLGALIEDAGELPKSDFTSDIRIDYIEVNPFQPRKTFDEESLLELASSIKELGVIQPITVRETEQGRYQLITGERRYRASKIAGLKEIPAYVRKADDQAMLELALTENIQRQDLDPVEIAISYQRLIEECRLTQEQLSERVGKKRSSITNSLRLLKLPAEIQLALRNRKISMGHALPLINIDNPETQISLCLQIIGKELSVRKTEEMVKNLFTKEKHMVKKSPVPIVNPEAYLQLQQHLSKYFNSHIQFRREKNGKGRIIIPFNSDEDLERIIGILDKLNS